MRPALLFLLLAGCAAPQARCTHYVINGRTVTLCPADADHVWVRDGQSYGRLP